MQPRAQQIAYPGATRTGSAWQVLVGSGCSPFDAKQTDITVSTTDRTYAWATVSVHQSGLVDVRTYGFSDTLGVTTLLRSVSLPH